MANILNLLSEETYAEKMNEQNALLRGVVLALGGETSYQVSSWATVQNLVRTGIAARVFQIGDQLVCNHSTYGTLTWDIIGIDQDTPVDTNYTHSLTLQTHDVLPATFQFDAPETNNEDANRKSTGSNNWKESALRQWLNTSKDAGTWWTAQTDYDVAPSYAGSTDGFIKGLDADFAECVGAVTKITARNTVTDGGGSDTTEDKFFIPSLTEVYGGQNNSIDEGIAYAYYKDNSTLTAAGTGNDTNRIKYKNGSTSGQAWWLRSPNPSNSTFVRNVDGTGYVSRGGASSSCGVAPACCII